MYHNLNATPYPVQKAAQHIFFGITATVIGIYVIITSLLVISRNDSQLRVTSNEAIGKLSLVIWILEDITAMAVATGGLM